ncbi:CU044_2847 family protein [Actinomycetota bacterium Odt1-20B]
MAADGADARTGPQGIDHLPDDGVLLVDFSPGRGLRPVATSPADLLRRSEAAVNSAMATIRSMARRVDQAVDELPRRPAEVEVEFGITLDAETGAMIAKVGASAALTVRLTWRSDPP